MSNNTMTLVPTEETIELQPAVTIPASLLDDIAEATRQAEALRAFITTNVDTDVLYRVHAAYHAVLALEIGDETLDRWVERTGMETLDGIYSDVASFAQAAHGENPTYRPVAWWTELMREVHPNG